MEDSEIVDLYWRRDQQAISETDRKYGRYCHTIAYNICSNGEDAEECVNDTWFRAWNLMPDKRPAILSTFLGYITRNLALNRYRAGSRKKRGGGETPLALEELTECVESGISVERCVEEKELEAAVDAFVQKLPEDERRLFIARYWFLLSIREISGRLGCSQSKAKTDLYRIRKALHRYLREEGLC